LIAKRESCRNFSTKPVELDQLKALVDVARMAPSADNFQPWHFYATNDPDVVSQITKACSPLEFNQFLKNVPGYILLTKIMNKEQWVPEIPYYDHFYADFDCGSAVTHICLAAAEEGLSTCIIGLFDAGRLQEICGCGDDEEVVVAIPVGYARTDNIRKKSRKPLDEVLTVLSALPPTRA